MTLIIVQTIIIALLSLLGGIVIGIALVVNKLNKTPNNPTLKMYNNYLSKQPRK